jgi:hypothetical protein
MSTNSPAKKKPYYDSNRTFLFSARAELAHARKRNKKALIPRKRERLFL